MFNKYNSTYLKKTFKFQEKKAYEKTRRNIIQRDKATI